jgi:succinate dehydrogenase/fumarate reductase iron-sulfur protein
MDVVRARIFRYDPETDQAPRYDTFEVPYRPLMRILDVLDYIHETLAEDIAYRWLCGVKKCGTCAVTVNGSSKLACWEPAEPDMTIEPLRNLPIVRDLVTARDPWDAWLAKIDPLLCRKERYPGFPEPLHAADMGYGWHLRDCIQCLACYAACPVLAEPDSGFGGPALLVALADLALDPRDGGDRARIADEVAGVFKCVSCYECDRVCPAEIPIVHDAIEPLKRKVYRGGAGEGARHARVFCDVVKERGILSAPHLVRAMKGASLEGLRTGLRMVARGKMSPVRAILGKRASGAETIKQLYESCEDGE